jgi:hypothetical protein
MNGFAPENPIPLSSTASPDQDSSGRKLPSSFEGIKQKHKGRGRPIGSKTGANARRDNPPPQSRPAPPPMPLFTPESVKPLVSLPFNLACVKTGFDGFLLREDETAVLCATGATVFNEWVTVDPKLVALIMFSISIMSISAEKALLFHRWTREIAEERKRREAEGNAAA